MRTEDETNSGVDGESAVADRESTRVNGQVTGVVAFARWLLEFALMVLVAFGVAFAVRAWVVQPYVVPTSSMSPTIEVGDHILANKYVYLTAEPAVGDIIVVDDPTGEVDTLVKRVVAVAGQTIELVDGRVVVDGVPLDEPYAHGLPSDPLAGGVTLPYTVPEGEVWLMGDNRTNSKDSRAFGAVPVNTVHGRVFAIYWPVDRIGSF